jgi:hypothetical protein
MTAGMPPSTANVPSSADHVQETEKGMIIRIKAGTDQDGNYRHKAEENREGSDHLSLPRC